jgi:hypothetical protein
MLPIMSCPDCGHENPLDSAECERCGVIFEKWEECRFGARYPTPVVYTDVPTPAPARSVPGIVVAVLALGGLLWLDAHLDGGEGSTEPTASQESRGSEEVPPSAPSTEGLDIDRGLLRLEGILNQIRRDGQMYGVTASLEDLRHWFEKGARPLAISTARYRGSRMGLPPPPRQEFMGTDYSGVRSGGRGAKCRIDGDWIYSADLPLEGPDEGVDECWRRLREGRADAWEQWSWQPTNQRWAPYPESTELRIIQEMIDHDYGFEAQRKDEQDSRERIRTIGGSPHYRDRPDLAAPHIKYALLAAYRSEVIRAGAEYRVEYQNSRNR